MLKPPSDNYAKCSRRDSFGRTVDKIYFFNSADLGGCIAAYSGAMATAKVMGGQVSLFKPPKHRGQWDRHAAIVGHRHLDDIMGDLCEAARSGDAAENQFYTDEVDSLQSRWRVRPISSANWEDD